MITALCVLQYPERDYIETREIEVSEGNKTIDFPYMASTPWDLSPAEITAAIRFQRLRCKRLFDAADPAGRWLYKQEGLYLPLDDAMTIRLVRDTYDVANDLFTLEYRCCSATPGIPSALFIQHVSGQVWQDARATARAHIREQVRTDAAQALLVHVNSDADPPALVHPPGGFAITAAQPLPHDPTDRMPNDETESLDAFNRKVDALLAEMAAYGEQE